MLKQVLCLTGLLLLPSFVHAAPAEDMAASLIDAKGRYTIGPWSGAELGSICTLTNSEPLAGADFVISAAKGGSAVTFTLGDKPAIVEEGLEGLSHLSYFTLSGHTYDMHGFARASALFKRCHAGQIPDELPDEPVEEGDPEAIAGAAHWSITRLTMGDYVYARLATLDVEGPFGLGLWRHNGNDYLLNITSLGDFPVLSSPPVMQITLSDGSLTLPATTQQGGVLVSLTAAQLDTLAKSAHLALQSGAFKTDFDVSDVDKAIAALKGE